MDAIPVVKAGAKMGAKVDAKAIVKVLVLIAVKQDVLRQQQAARLRQINYIIKNKPGLFYESGPLFFILLQTLRRVQGKSFLRR